MSKNKVGDLVLKAKGERSYREYQRDTGVDAAVISKIVKGTYIPKNPEVYRKLTSGDSNGVTFEELIDAAKYSSEYKSGMIAGAAVSQAALAAIGGSTLAMLPGVGVILAGIVGATGAVLKNSTKKAQEVEKVESYVNALQRFSAISKGIIFSKLAQKGILFQENTTEKNRLFDNQVDTYLKIQNQLFSEYVFRYLYVDQEFVDNEKLVESASRRMIEELTFSIPDKKRKISIVTNSVFSFEYLKNYAGKISYRGNLTVILLNTQRVEFVEEIVLATHDEISDIEGLIIE